jgi:hypothetical protein
LPLHYLFDTGTSNIHIAKITKGKGYATLYRFKNLKDKTDEDRSTMKEVITQSEIELILTLPPVYVRSCIDLEILEELILAFEQYFRTNKFPDSNEGPRYNGQTRIYDKYAQCVHCLVGFTVDFGRLDLLERIIPMLQHPFSDDGMLVIYERNNISERALQLLIDSNVGTDERIGALALHLLHGNIMRQLAEKRGDLTWLKADVHLIIADRGGGKPIDHEISIPIPYIPEEDFVTISEDLVRFGFIKKGRFIEEIIFTNMYTSLVNDEYMRPYTKPINAINNYSVDKYNEFISKVIKSASFDRYRVTRYTTSFEMRYYLEYPDTTIKTDESYSFYMWEADPHSNLAAIVSYLYQMKSLNTEDYILRDVLKKGLLLRLVVSSLIIKLDIPIIYRIIAGDGTHTDHPAIVNVSGDGFIIGYLQPDGTRFPT